MPVSPSRPRRSPLRAPAGGVSGVVFRDDLSVSGPVASGLDLRKMMISEFCDSLRTRNNKDKRPFAGETITAYKTAARALDAWMTSQEVDGDFTVCDTEMLNRFFADYLSSHGQTGTNTKQRNLRHLFTWLERRYGHPHPYTDDLNRYAALKTRPSTLSVQFISDLLEVTGNGRAQDFADARDHALIRLLCEGVRRTEVTQLQMSDLSADLIARPFIRVTPLKGARAQETGRLVPLSPGTARALVAYLRFRRDHARSSSPYLWLGLRKAGPMDGWGLYRMLKRRAEQAGYDPEVHPHQFRHTFASDWRSKGGSEGDLMRLMGWRTRAMLDRYGEDMADQRAFDAKHQMGDLY
jgi:integrase/recombinase XerD